MGIIIVRNNYGNFSTRWQSSQLQSLVNCSSWQLYTPTTRNNHLLGFLGTTESSIMNHASIRPDLHAIGLVLRVIGETFVDITNVNCFLCGSTRIKQTRDRRPVNYHVNRYFYKCRDCKALSLWPKLENWEIQKLYSANYIGDVAPGSSLDYESDRVRFTKLEHYLTRISDRGEKLYLDFGCGASANTLILAKALGFQAFGVEVAEDTRKQANLVSGCEIYSPEEIATDQHRFDIVFMGDVLEHVMDPILLLESAQNSLKSGGVLVIQGPLEGAVTLSNFFVSLKAQIFFRRPSTFPPYHVSLARRNSILKMLRVRDLTVVDMEITEPYWPAPRFGSKDSFVSPSKFLLSLTKLIDIGIHRINKSYGTRFFLLAIEN